jgi:hypothetical protein
VNDTAPEKKQRQMPGKSFDGWKPVENQLIIN